MTLIPSVPIECRAVPSVGQTRYGGFGAGEAPERWHAPAGQLILDHHAVSTSHTAGWLGPLTTNMPVLHRQYGIDSERPDHALAKIDQLVSQRRGGMSLFLHPSVLDLEGKISTGEYVQVLERAAALRDKGLVAVITVGALSITDPSTPPTSALGSGSSRARRAGPPRRTECGSLGRSAGCQRMGARSPARDPCRCRGQQTRIHHCRGGRLRSGELSGPHGHHLIRRPLTVPLDADTLTVREHSKSRTHHQDHGQPDLTPPTAVHENITHRKGDTRWRDISP